MNSFELNLNNNLLVAPSKSVFNDIAYKRGLIHKNNEIYALEKYRAGMEGEAILRSYLREYGNENWTVLRNVWLDYYGTFECDLILFTDTCCYVFEVKNYTGLFCYEDGSCTLNWKRLSSNCVQQARRAAMNIESICGELAASIKVQGVLAFVGVDNHVEICSTVDDLRVIQRTQLLNFIRQIVKAERNEQVLPVKRERIIKCFERYQTSNPFAPEPVTQDQMMEVRKGIYCKACVSYSILVKKQQVICEKCGVVEDRKEAVLRTICDYGVLNYDKDLKTGRLLDFFDGQVGRNYLIKVLIANFDRKSNHRSTYYVNNSYNILERL